MLGVICDDSPATLTTPDAAVAQLAERVICNLEVTGSIPVGGFFLPEAFPSLVGVNSPGHVARLSNPM